MKRSACPHPDDELGPVVDRPDDPSLAFCYRCMWRNITLEHWGEE